MAPKAQPAWQIYEEQMECLCRGHALWEPAPTSGYTRINIGDVGFIRQGRFHLLFSAGLPLGERKLGDEVPNTFQQLVVGKREKTQPRDPGCFSARTSRQPGASLDITESTLQFLEPGVDCSVELTGHRGGALATRHPTYNEDSHLEDEFEEYTKRYYKSWVQFAGDKRYGKNLRPVLVSGFDMAKDFAMTAYSKNYTSLEPGETISIPMFGSASESASWKWRTARTPHIKHGPQQLEPPDLPASESGARNPSTEFNQCVFIRYYTMREGFLPRVIRAGAGPHDLGSGENRGGGFHELTVRYGAEPMSDDGDIGGQWNPATNNTASEVGIVIRNVPYDGERDSWDAIAEYVFKNSDATSVLMHHKDLAGIRAMGHESDISSLLAIHKPPIVLDKDGVGGIVCRGDALSLQSSTLDSTPKKSRDKNVHETRQPSPHLYFNPPAYKPPIRPNPLRIVVTQTIVRGIFPPPQPTACFGRDELIEEIVSLAQHLEPVALIGAGGIGKTSIALVVLHDDRIKKRFGDNRRFIRCDQLALSLPHFLNRLSKVIGAGVENPEDLTPLRPSLSSREMILFLDNAESILDPQRTEAREIYAVVEELGRFPNICLGITSRISTVPPHFKRPTISTLSTESACNIFYSIYDMGGRSGVISNLVRELDFHALSITLLATTAYHNMWDYDELAGEWNAHRSQALQTDYGSLAATIELSLASPTFRKLGPHARDLLGVIAFFPQGIDKNNLDWLFPTIPDRKKIFDNFCALSLTSRTDNFITMLTPIRDHLHPQNPRSSPLLSMTRDHYFTRLSVEVDPDAPGFEEARWIVSEDVNIEYLLDVSTSLDMNSDTAWGVCVHFMEHLYWHKNRYTVFGSKIKRLADDRPSKPTCLIELSRLFHSVGNFVEQKRLVTHALKLVREQENEFQVIQALVSLSQANRMLGLPKEGIQQSKEALGILERLGDTFWQARCWNDLADLFRLDGQLDAAEEAATHSMDLLPEKGQEFRVCQSHQILGRIHRSKKEREKAIHRFEQALAIASAFEWHGELFLIHYSLARLFVEVEDRFNDAHGHIDQAKSHARDDAYNLGCAMELKAQIWYRQHRFEYVVPEALDALEIFEKLGVSKGIANCRNILQKVEREIAACGAPASGSTNTVPIH